MAWHGMPRCDMAWHGMTWHGMAWHGMPWYGMVWYSMVYYGIAWYGLVWFGMVCITDQHSPYNDGKVDSSIVHAFVIPALVVTCLGDFTTHVIQRMYLKIDLVT